MYKWEVNKNLIFTDNYNFLIARLDVLERLKYCPTKFERDGFLKWLEANNV